MYKKKISKLKRNISRKKPRNSVKKYTKSSSSRSVRSRKSKLALKKIWFPSVLKGKIDNSLYPFWFNKIPFPRVSDENLIEDETWKPHLKLASKLYKDKSYLPKATVLFHGSGILNPIANLRKTKTPFFFGLDAFIAIWYISEFAQKHTSNFERLLTGLDSSRQSQESEIENLKKFDRSIWKASELEKMKKNYTSRLRKIIEEENHFISSIKLDGFDDNFSELLYDLKSHNRRYYFLNIYETKENIEYQYLDRSIRYQNPLDEEQCSSGACMHPQFGYHLHELKTPVELSIEFTIPANQIGNKLKLIGVYLIDVFKLNENKDKNFNNFKAIESIVLKSDGNSNNDERG